MKILREHMNSLEDGMKGIVESKAKVLADLYGELLRQVNYANSLTLEDLWKDLMGTVFEYSMDFLSDKISDIEDLLAEIKKDGVGKYTDAIEIVLSIFQSDTYQYLVRTAKLTQNSLESAMGLLSDVVIREAVISLPATKKEFKEMYSKAIKDVNSGAVNSKTLRTAHAHLVESVEKYILGYLKFMTEALSERNEEYEEELKRRIYYDLKKYIFLMADFIQGETRFKQIHDRYSNELNSFISQNALNAYETGDRYYETPFTDRYYKNREEAVPVLIEEAHNFIDEIDRVTGLEDFKRQFTNFMTDPVKKFFSAQELMKNMTTGSNSNIVNIPRILSEINIIDDLKLIGIKYDMKELVNNELIWTNRLIINGDDTDFMRIRAAILEKIRQTPEIYYKYPGELDQLMKTVVYGLMEAISKYTRELLDWDEEKMVDDTKANVEKIIITMSTLHRNMGYTETVETMLALNAAAFPKNIVIAGTAYAQVYLLAGVYSMLTQFVLKADDIEKAMLLLGDYLNIEIVYQLPNLVDNLFYYIIGKYIDFTPLANLGPESDKVDVFGYIDKVKTEIKKVEESLDIFSDLKKLL